MGRQKAREGAVAMLKETLTRRFGTTLRDVVEAEVDGHLAGRSRLEREDLEAIESGILAASRQRRGGGSTRRGLAMSRSAPDIRAPAPSAAASVASEPPVQPPPRPTGQPLPPSATAPLTATPNARHSLGRQPPGTAGSRRSQSSAHSLASSMRAPQPPYGLSIVDENPFERSQSQVVPAKYPVPLRSKLKPMDHWDMIVAFDATKHHQQVKAFDKSGKAVRQKNFKAVLDGQMDELQGIQGLAEEEKRQETATMLARIEENKRFEAAEQEKRDLKKAKMVKTNQEIFAMIAQRKKEEEQQKQQDIDKMHKWLEEERERKEKEQQALLEEHRRKCLQGREEMAAAYREAENRKKAQQEEDRRVVVAQEKAMDENEVNKSKHLQKRMDKIERNTRVLGAAIAARNAKMEQEEEERIRRTTEEADRAAKADTERKQTEHQKRVREMLDGLGKQITDREVVKRAEREEDKKQGEIWRRQLEESEREEKEKADRARKARESLDVALIGQIRESVSTHPQHFGMTVHSQKQDIAYNRILYEQMASEGFRNDFTGQLLGPAPKHSKLEHYPSVGRWEEPLHPLEMQVPDF